MSVIKLLDNVSVDTTGSAIRGDGGSKLLFVSGTLGGGTISLEISNEDQSVWVPATFLDGAAFAVTSTGAFILDRFPTSLFTRAVLSGSTGASNVTVLVSG